MPGNILGVSGWNLGNGFYLLDDLNGNGSGSGFHAMDASGPPFPGGGGEGGGGDGSGVTNNFSYASPTNGLWLQITNVSNCLVYANLNGATDYVYEVYSTTNLAHAAMAVSNWDIETEVFPSGSTNATPFTVPMNGRSPLFLWARDWTGITSGGNQTPESWFWDYFGTVDLSDSDLDSLGVSTLLYDFQNGLDPNAIQFFISVTNQYVNDQVPLQLNVTAGQPSEIAVLVDDTNSADTVWNPYTSSSITVDCGSIQGWHNVYVGLRGLPAKATQTWVWQHLDFVSAPLLVITNPVSSVVNVPVIQIYGHAQEQLANISYDISNAFGVVTNEPGFISDEYFDTNQLGITTNYFQCLDIPLTNGPNVVTLHATDMAGDTTLSNFDFTLDYSAKTNPPVVQITWPQNGTQISGANFICTGWIGDPTARISTQVVLTNGDTNFYANGVYTNVYTAGIDRSGNFSIQNIPLSSGTNAFLIKAVDAVGNTLSTNLTVVQTAFVLTMDPQPPISQPAVDVSGNISDPTYAVWVNGVKGVNNGDGTWSADSVPAANGIFNVTAYGPTEQQPDGSYGN